jgi:predicted RNA-binding protein with RPS1 domain
VQRSVTLSPSEAEYVVISEVCAEVMFVKQILEFLKVKVELQIQVMVDNVGAIYLTDNQSVSQRTRHIDIRYHFVREYVEDGIVKINFVQSEENDADIFTKNLGSELFKKHASKFIKERQ